MTGTLNIADLIFLQDQIAAGDTPGPGFDPFSPVGIRTLDGTNNNVSGFVILDQHGNVVNTATFGNLDQAFVEMGSTTSPLAYLNSTQGGFNPMEMDSSPRTVSNLIVDQSDANPAAASADLLHPGDPTMDILPANSWFTFFGQFFDHGLDFVAKGGDGVVAIPLLESDPLFDAGATGPGANMMFLSRATLDVDGNPVNTTAPFIEQSQTYGSAASTTFYLKEYDSSGNATGDLVGGANGLATWADIKANANTWAQAQAGADPATVMLTDEHINDIPNPATWDPSLNAGLGGFADIVGPPAITVSTGQSFLADIAHNANPYDMNGNFLTADANGSIDPHGFGEPGPASGEYDNELLDAHFIAGDPRANENVALSTVHEVFHNEHSRILDQLEELIAQQEIVEPGFAALWNGDTLFQAAKLVNEMQYQHMVFEEFGRRMSPNIDAFGDYDVNINPNITAEFAHAVYRLGHSQLTDVVRAIDVTGAETQLSLVDAFLDPEMFAQFGGADFAKGSQFEQGSQIDEFVVDSLRNFLVGVPLDLAALNIARGRDVGLPSLNQFRAEMFAETGESSLQAYTSWADFGSHMLNPASLVNFIAAYGDHASLDAVRATPSSLTFIEDLRAAANTLLSDNTFMNGASAVTGLDTVDLWIGGLAEEKVPLGMLGSTFDFVFAQQMIALQDGDRFYYLGRIGGNFLDQIESQTFSDLMMRGTGAMHLNGDAFGTADVLIELGTLGVMDLMKTPAELAEVIHEVIGGTNADNTIHGGGGNDTIWGDGGDDILFGGAADDHVYGGDGDDEIWGEVGFDFLRGDGGADIIHGGSDDDAISGGDGDDMLFGDNGFDAVLGNAGDDIIFGGAQDDELLGGEGNDTIHGGTGDDLVAGENGNDVLFGDAGADQLVGDLGDDFLVGGSGADDLDGGIGGYDIASYETWQAGVPSGLVTGLTINMQDTALSTGDARDDSYLEIEAIRGSDHDDTIVGTDLVGMTLIGRDGNDNISGGILDDTLIGSEGNDTLIGGAGEDTALVRGLEADFTLSLAIGGFNLTDNNAGDGDEGVDFVQNSVEWLSFDDALLNLGTLQYAPLIGLSGTATRIQNGSEIIGEAEAIASVMDGQSLAGANGLEVADIIIDDPDGANGGALTFTLTGDDAALFTTANIGGVQKLFLSGNGPLSATNYEVKPVYNVTVNVADAIGGSAINYTLRITDVNDNAPVIVSGDQANVREGASTNTIVYRAQSTDLDTTGEVITYSIDPGSPDAAAFTMINGEIRFNSVPNFEAPGDIGGDNVYNLTILATDGINPAVPKDIEIHVTNAPAALTGDIADTVDEDSGAPVNTVATGTVAKADPDDPDETFTTVTSGAATYGTWSVTATGDWTYTLDDGHPDVDDLDTGESLEDTFTLISDAGTSQEITITINGTTDVTIAGTNAGETITGTLGVDFITAHGGDDTVHALAGDDKVVGGSGLDTINGGEGDDDLFGQGGVDTLNGGIGNDSLVGGEGGDILNGGVGNDVLRGQNGLDILNGGDGDDQMFGQGDVDTMNGGIGDDRMVGGDGADIMNGEADADNMFGQNGADIMDGGDGADRLNGGADGDTLNGGLGADVILGGTGSDIITGGDGNDLITGGTEADTYVFSANWGVDTIFDFADGSDIFDMTALGLTDGVADLLITQVGLATHIQLDEDGNSVADTSDTIILNGIFAPQIEATDFTF